MGRREMTGSKALRGRSPPFLLVGPRQGERTQGAHVLPGGLDPAVGAPEVRDAELVDVAVEGIGDAAPRGLGFQMLPLAGPADPTSLCQPAVMRGTVA
jgi:hypothetical protein